MPSNLMKIKNRINIAAEKCGRDGQDVTLVAVSKIHTADTIRPVLKEGHRIFGENRVQEAAQKWPALKEEFKGVTLHLIGPLQTNKVRQAVTLFDVIETVDRPRLAQTLARVFEETGQKCDIFIQINTGLEDQKAGVVPNDADHFIALCRDDLNLPVVGIMCIPPVDEDPISHFKLMCKIAKRNDLKTISMGMSGDYELAIEHGATHVRVGTAIFGTRPVH